MLRVTLLKKGGLRMETNSWNLGRLFKLPRATLIGGLLLSLAIVALACSPAEEPAAPAAPVAVATQAPAAIATEEPAAVEEEATVPVAPAATAGEAQVVSTAVKGFEQYQTGEGVFKTMGGLQVWIPEGYTHGGPIIPPDPRKPQFGGLFVFGANADPPSLDPYHTTSVYMTNNVGRSYERLIHLPAGPGVDQFVDNRVGGLAESWEWGDDFLTLKFNLRKGVKWQNIAPVNGREFDSEDVKWTFDKFSHPESIQKGFYANVEKVTTPDKYTAIYHLKIVDLNMFAVLSDPGRGFMLPRESDEINRKLTVIGTGAFQMTSDEYEYKLGNDYVRNPDYWEKDADGNAMPYLDGVKLRVIGDPTARNAAFRTGKIDAGIAISTPDSASDMMKTNPTTIIQEYTFPYSTANTGFRHDKEPWSDVRVRRAMALAIDWESLSQTVWGVPANPWVAISGAWYGEATNDLATLNGHTSGNWYSYDPDRAKALLAEAGYPDGFKTSLEYYPYSPSHTEAHEFKQAYWKEVGVDVDIKSLDYSVFRANLDAGSWTDLGGWTFIYPYASSLEGAILDLKPGHGQNENTGFILDDELVSLVDQVYAAYADIDKRYALMEKVRARYLDQVLSLPWPSGHGYGANAPRMRNYQSRNSAIVSNDMRFMNYVWLDDAWSFN
jgi:peptide/nickel transport system substrate-binding protein